MALKGTIGEYELPDPGMYVVRLRRVGDPEEGKFGYQVRWEFELFDPGDGSPVFDSHDEQFVLFQRTSTSLGPKAKARAWGEALRGASYQKDEPFDSDLLVGKTALAAITHAEKDTGTFANIATLTPMKAPKKARPAAVAITVGADGADMLSEEPF